MGIWTPHWASSNWTDYGPRGNTVREERDVNTCIHIYTHTHTHSRVWYTRQKGFPLSWTKYVPALCWKYLCLSLYMHICTFRLLLNQEGMSGWKIQQSQKALKTLDIAFFKHNRICHRDFLRCDSAHEKPEKILYNCIHTSHDWLTLTCEISGEQVWLFCYFHVYTGHKCCIKPCISSCYHRVTTKSLSPMLTLLICPEVERGTLCFPRHVLIHTPAQKHRQQEETGLCKIPWKHSSSWYYMIKAAAEKLKRN